MPTGRIELRNSGLSSELLKEGRHKLLGAGEQPRVELDHRERRFVTESFHDHVEERGLAVAPRTENADDRTMRRVETSNL